MRRATFDLGLKMINAAYALHNSVLTKNLLNSFDMHKIYFCLSIFYTLEDSAWCYSIQILTIGDFNSFGFFGTPCSDCVKTQGFLLMGQNHLKRYGISIGYG